MMNQQADILNVSNKRLQYGQYFPRFLYFAVISFAAVIFLFFK